MKSCLIIIVIIDHLELGLEPEPAHVVTKPPKYMQLLSHVTNGQYHEFPD